MALAEMLVHELARRWWVLLVLGLVALAFAILTFLRPGITLSTLVLLFGFFSLADGILGVWAALAHRHSHRWTLLLGGLVGIAIGILTLAAPRVTAFALLLYIAFWAIATGVLEIIVALRLRKEIEGEWLLVLAGVLSVGFGLALIIRPGAGALAVAWLIATYATIFGIVLIALSFEVKSFGRMLATR
jgi:uncharacterized membrane protein HdeD (DUF308 family)